MRIRELVARPLEALWAIAPVGLQSAAQLPAANLLVGLPAAIPPVGSPAANPPVAPSSVTQCTGATAPAESPVATPRSAAPRQ